MPISPPDLFSSFSLPESWILSSLSTPWLPYRRLNLLPKSLTLQKQPDFKLRSSIPASNVVVNNLFEACNIVEAKDEETTEFISRKVDVIVELAANKAYWETILKNSFNSTFDIKSSISTVDSGLDKGLETNTILSSGQLLWQSQKRHEWLKESKTNNVIKKLIIIFWGKDLIPK